MLIDTNLFFADATALSTAGTGTSKYGNSVNLKTALMDQGEGHPMWLCAYVHTVVTSGGSATLQLALTGADNQGLTTNPENYFLSDAFTIAQLTPAGTRLFITALPKRLYKQHLGIRQIIGTAALTAGALNVFITSDPDNWRSYAQGSAP